MNLFNLNPNINNTSIPFLYVFDMDKAFDFKFSNKKAVINLKKNGELFSFKPTQLKEEIKKYERGFSDEYKQIARSLKEIESFDEAFFDYNKSSHFFTDSSQLAIDKLTLAVSTYSSKKNIIFLSTTFEGCLINEYSSSLFFKWLSHEHQIDASSIINRLATSSAFSEKILISFLRIIFNGKSEILTKFGQIESKEKNSNRYTHHAARRVLKITERAFLKYGDKTDKTSGWVTKFLNFAIEEIEKSEPDEGFERKFSVYFPELYSILNRLRT